MITVSRPVNGVTLNGDECLSDDKDKVRQFLLLAQAEHFLKEAGLGDEPECMNFNNEGERYGSK